MISFIIPTFNEERAIERTLKSISQYRGEHEIIVSDDNSMDDTVVIAKRHTEKIVLNRGERRCAAATRNRGVDIASGKFLVFIDCDVYIKDIDIFFYKASAVFEKNERVMAMTVFNRVEDSLVTWADKIILGFFNYLFLLLNNVLHFGASSGKFQMVRTDAFRTIKGFNENLVTGEDHDLFRRLAAKGRIYSEKILSIYYSGRRAHTIGWPKLLWLWGRDTISVIFLRRSLSSIWKDIR